MPAARTTRTPSRAARLAWIDRRLADLIAIARYVGESLEPAADRLAHAPWPEEPAVRRTVLSRAGYRRRLDAAILDAAERCGLMALLREISNLAWHRRRVREWEAAHPETAVEVRAAVAAAAPRRPNQRRFRFRRASG